MKKTNLVFLRWAIGGVILIWGAACSVRLSGDTNTSLPPASSAPDTPTPPELTPLVSALPQTPSVPDTSTPLALTSPVPIVSSTPPLSLTPTLMSTPTPQSLLPPLSPGQYLVYRTLDMGFLDFISMDGSIQGQLFAGEGDLSPDGKQLAHEWNKIYGDQLRITDLEHNVTTVISDTYDCFYHAIRLAWSPDGNLLAVPCGKSIYVLTIPDGKAIGIIPSPVADEHVGIGDIYWSPNGKWIAFDIAHENRYIGDEGPFVTDTSCFSEQTCKARTWKLNVVKGYAVLAWTPDSHLALSPTEQNDHSIRVYDVKTQQLLRTISVPNQYELDSMVWSPDGKWIAVGQIGISIVPVAGGQPVLVTNASRELAAWLSIP